MTDRTVYIEANTPQTFILTPVLWHYLSVNLDADPVTKLPPYMTKEFTSSVLGSIFPTLLDKSLAFTDFSGPAPISVEEVLEANPDAVLIWNYMVAGLELVNFQGTLQIAADGGDKTKLFNLLGGLTGKEDWVSHIWERFYQERDEVLLGLDNCPQKTRVGILGGAGFNLWGGPSQRYLFNNMLMVCGENVAPQMSAAGGVLNVENLLILDPDVLLLNPYVLDQTDMRVSAIYEDPRFQGLKAVRNRRVYHMPLGASRLEGPVEVPLSMLWLREILNPFNPSNLNLRDKIRETYLDIYGYEVTESQIDTWLRLEENQDSAYYDRFIRTTNGKQ
jgi:iron complex transport system substrate-binding protein